MATSALTHLIIGEMNVTEESKHLYLVTEEQLKILDKKGIKYTIKKPCSSFDSKKKREPPSDDDYDPTPF